MIDYAALVQHLAATAPAPFGLLSQQATPTAARLRRAFGNRLKCLFSPEHGWFGLAAAGEKTSSETHPLWHIPVHSLYGAARRPSPEMFEGLARIVVDLQDIGVRCYTYLATLKNMLEAAAAAHLPVTVLDRPIPLGGVIDGPRREARFSSFVAPLDIPLCHGMTPGECATYIVREGKLAVDLTVIRMRDWSHARREPWTNFTPPSPAIRNWDCAALYPATVFTEAYPALDCDRDGPFAFRVLGAPWLDAVRLLEDIGKVLPACGFGVRPLRYRPSGGPYGGQVLDGLILSIENPGAFYPVTAGALILNALMRRHGRDLLQDARAAWLDKLAGTDTLRAALASNRMSDLFQTWLDAHDAYRAARVDLYA